MNLYGMPVGGFDVRVTLTYMSGNIGLSVNDNTFPTPPCTPVNRPVTDREDNAILGMVGTDMEEWGRESMGWVFHYSQSHPMNYFLVINI